MNAAIIGAAVLDEALQIVLLNKMQPLSKTMERELFKGYGPLSNFSAKMDISYAFQLIDRQTYDDLKRINKIRVECAHTSQWRKFAEPEMMDLFSRFPDWKDDNKEPVHFYLGKLRQIVDRLAKITEPAEHHSQSGEGHQGEA